MVCEIEIIMTLSASTHFVILNSHSQAMTKIVYKMQIKKIKIDKIKFLQGKRANNTLIFMDLVFLRDGVMVTRK
jgi:hypothetical protein